MKYVSSLLFLNTLLLSHSLYSASLIDTLSEKDFTRHIEKNYGFKVVMKRDKGSHVQTGNHALVLNNISIITIHDKHYLECTISKDAWETQRSDINLLLKFANIWYCMLAVATVMSGGSAWIYFDEIFHTHEFTKRYIGMHKAWAIAKFATSLIMIPYIIKKFAEQVTFVDYLHEVAEDEFRILGFKMISMDYTEVRVRTDFPINVSLKPCE